MDLQEPNGLQMIYSQAKEEVKVWWTCSRYFSIGPIV